MRSRSQDKESYSENDRCDYGDDYNELNQCKSCAMVHGEMKRIRVSIILQHPRESATRAMKHRTFRAVRSTLGADHGRRQCAQEIKEAAPEKKGGVTEWIE